MISAMRIAAGKWQLFRACALMPVAFRLVVGRPLKAEMGCQMGVMGCDGTDGNHWPEGWFHADATPSPMHAHIVSCLTIQRHPLIPESWDRVMLVGSQCSGGDG